MFSGTLPTFPPHYANDCPPHNDILSHGVHEYGYSGQLPEIRTNVLVSQVIMASIGVTCSYSSRPFSCASCKGQYVRCVHGQHYKKMVEPEKSLVQVSFFMIPL